MNTNPANGLSQRCAELAFESHNAGGRARAARFALSALVLNPRHASRRGLASLIVQSVLGIRRRRTVAPPSAVEQARARVAGAPRSVQAHMELAAAYRHAGKFICACACESTARVLAQDLADGSLAGAVVWPADLIGQTALHDPYMRMQMIARRIRALAAEGRARVLEIGGGDGYLGALLPGMDYALAEPIVNGIGGEQLPFLDRSFDVVVALHALEHLPAALRPTMLDEMIRVSRRHIVILGPFAPPPGSAHVEEAIIEATGMTWAKEHMDNGLPQLAAVTAHMESRGLSCTVTPNADARVMYWQALAHHFAMTAGSTAEIDLATSFFQQHFDYSAGSQLPHDYLLSISH